MPVYVDGAIVPAPSADPTGPAGGVLTGTYPDPGLNKNTAAADLELGNAAYRNVGTASGDVAVGTTTTTASNAATAAATAQTTASGAASAASAAQATANAAIAKSTLTATGDLLAASGAATPAVIAAPAAGKFLRGAGTGTLPAYSTLTLPDTAPRGSVLVATGANAVAALPMQTLDTFGGGDGTDFVARTAAQVLAATRAAAVTTPSLASEVAGGWTPSAVVSPGSVTVTGGAIVTTIPNASNTTNAGGFELRAWPAYGDNVEIVARYTETGDATNAILALQFVEWASGSVYWALGAGGTWDLYSNLASENTSVAQRTGMPRNGTGWTKLRINGQRITAWTGIGVGSAAPLQTAWTLLYDGDRAGAIGKSVPTMMEIGGRSIDTHAVSGLTTISWSDISITDLTQGA